MSIKHRDSDDSMVYTTNSSSEDERETRKNSKASAGGGARKSNAIIPRPNASSGIWLCCLLPLAYATRYVHVPLESTPCGNSTAETHPMLTVAAIGMCVQSLCFFIYMFLDTGILFKMIISLVPGLITAALYTLLLQETWWISLLAGFGVTVIYQSVYIRIMKKLPLCFSFGEATVIVQGLLLFVISALHMLYELAFSQQQQQQQQQNAEIFEFAQLQIIMMSALLGLLIVCVLLASVRLLRRTLPFYLLMTFLLIAVTCAPVTKPLPIIALFNFMLNDQKRLKIIAFYLLLVGLTVATVSWQLRNTTRASTSVRKIFHLLIVLVYVPGLMFQCAFLYIASGVALAMFAVIELFRILDVPPLAARLKAAFTSFKDEKDAGLLALTPFSLLIGCSIPIWLTPCACSATRELMLSLLAGILAVGVGDTAASVVGSKLGYNKWKNSNRSLEGTLAFTASVLVAVLSMNLLDVLPMTQAKWFATIFATLNAALVEAHTDQIDNLVLPLVFYIIVSLA